MLHRAAVVAVLAVAATACSAGGEDGLTTAAVTTSSPATSPAADHSADDAVTPQGFDLVAATVTKADGEVCEVCLWLAETPAQRALGLMNVTDLGNADGMAFVYPLPRTGNFWMKDTLLPLSIAFFGAGGDHLGEFDMDPCTADPCPRYRTARDFVIAVETHQGELPELGIGPGSSIELTDLPCP